MMTYLGLKVAIFVTFAVAGTVASISRAHRRSKRRAAISAASSVFDDHALVTMKGTVKMIGAPIEAPLSGRDCVAFRATARTYKDTPVLMRPGRTLREVESTAYEAVMTPFILVTRDGEVIVEGEACELPDHSAPIIPRKMDRETAFMLRIGLGGDARLAGFDEVVIQAGDKIMVHGVARKQLAEAGETTFREAPQKLTIGGQDETTPVAIDFV